MVTSVKQLFSSVTGLPLLRQFFWIFGYFGYVRGKGILVTTLHWKAEHPHVDTLVTLSNITKKNH